MSTSGEGSGRALPGDLYDLALAGARLVLADRSPDGDGALRATASTLALRHDLRGLAPAWERAGAALVARGAIAAADLEGLIRERAEGESLGQLVLRRTDIPESVVAEILAEATGTSLVALTTDPVHGDALRAEEDALGVRRHPVLVDEVAARRIPQALSGRHDVIVVAAWEDAGVLAMVDPGDDAAAWEAEQAIGHRLVRVAALASHVRAAVLRCWQPRPDVEVPATGSPRQALPFLTAVGVPATVAVAIFLFVFRDTLNLRYHFALAALAIGLFFFSYAFRYYVTTAAVIGTVLFGDRLRRHRLVSRIRAARTGGTASARQYRTLRGEQLDDVGAIVTADPERIGAHRLPRDRQPFVSVQLAMYNERHVVDRLLEACTSFDYDAYEVIVADDSTDPEALAILDRWSAHPRVRVLHRETRKGFKGGALQEALRRMDPRTEYVMIFDADFIPPPDAIWHFLDYFGRLPAPDGSNGNGHHAGDLRAVATGVPENGDRLAAVQGYQWHMLNASENWITRGIRTEFSGSYVLERAAQELFGTMKMISGSVYMIRADVLRRLGWSTSITEDWELTIRLYLAGYKVLYTPYIQAPSECVSSLRQLVRQRMRWARGHTFNVKRYFFAILRSPRMSWREKAEFLYYAPYYLQSILFLLGTVAWVLGIFLMGQRLPQWSAALGWSLVVSNVLALPLMNLAGLILEGSVKRDLAGLGSFVALSTLLAPFQGWAALRGVLEPTEGGWHRTAKSGHITEALGALRLGRLLRWELPRRRISSRAAHVVVTCIAGILAGAILTVGALSMRAAATSGRVPESDLIVPFAVGTLVPLVALAYGWFRLHRRIAVCILAFAVGLSANVVFLASTIPASATAGLSSTFMFKNATTFQSPNKDMVQGYTPSGAASQIPVSLGLNWTAIFSSDTFTSTMSMASGTAVVDLYGENNVATISFVNAGAQVSNTTGNLSPQLPSGWQANDVAVLIVAGRPTSSQTGEPSVTGWTKRTSMYNDVSGTATDLKIITYWRVLQSGDSGPSVSTSSWNNGMSAQIAAWRGVNTSAPFDTADATGESNASDPWSGTPSITTTLPNVWVASAVATSDDNRVQTGGSNGFTDRMSGITYDTTVGADHAVGLADKEIASAGAVTMAAWDQVANGADEWAAITFALRPETRNCTITAELSLDVGGTGGTLASLGSGTGTFASPSSETGTLTQISFSIAAVDPFGDGDRLYLTVTAPNDATNCNARVHYDGASQQSKLVTATIVPEAILGLLLAAPLLPVAVRRRWIRLPFAR